MPSIIKQAVTNTITCSALWLQFPSEYSIAFLFSESLPLKGSITKLLLTTYLIADYNQCIMQQELCVQIFKKQVKY